jgi:hypothetical protein
MKRLALALLLVPVLAHAHWHEDRHDHYTPPDTSTTRYQHDTWSDVDYVDADGEVQALHCTTTYVADQTQTACY